MSKATNRADNVIEFETETESIISEFINTGLQGRADNTIKAYRRSINAFAGFLTDEGTVLSGYARTDVQSYINHLERNLKRKPSGVNREFAAIRAFSRWAGNNEAIEDIRIVQPAKLSGRAPQWLSRNKRNAIIRETEKKANKRDHAIVMTLLGAGLRVSELVALDRDDVTMSDRKGSVHVRDSKGGHERTVSLGSETRRAITKYLKQRTDDNRALFTSQLKRRISVRSVQQMLSNYDVTPHQLRHTYIKALVDKGHDLALIMSLSGHDSAEMIAWYSTPSDEEKQQAVESLYD